MTQWASQFVQFMTSSVLRTSTQGRKNLPCWLTYIYYLYIHLSIYLSMSSASRLSCSSLIMDPRHWRVLVFALIFGAKPLWHFRANRRRIHEFNDAWQRWDLFDVPGDRQKKKKKWGENSEGVHDPAELQRLPSELLVQRQFGSSRTRQSAVTGTPLMNLNWVTAAVKGKIHRQKCFCGI